MKIKRKFMFGDCLERMKAFFKITKKGRDELETTYNRNYIDPHQQLENKKRLQEKHGLKLDKYKLDKRTALRNCVSPRVGLHILNESKRDIQPELFR